MNKKILVFSIFVLGFLFSFNNVQAVTYPDGCTATYAYSTTTGQKCSPLPDGCTSTSLYSVTTGQKCTSGNVLGESTDSTITGSISLPTSCSISLYYNSCLGVPFSWDTQNAPLNTSRMVQTVNPTPAYFTPMNVLLNSWSTTSMSIPKGVSTFTLTNSGTTSILDQKYITAECASGLAWNGSYCAVATTVTPTATPSITVVSPNGGEVYSTGQQVEVKWTSTGIPSTDNIQIYIQYDGSNGGYSSTVAGINPSGQQNFANDGSEIIILPSSLPWAPSDPWHSGKYYKIYIEYRGTLTPVSDYSNNTFTINAPTTTCNPSITVLSPNGGEVYQAGQQVTVKWETCNVSSTKPIALSLITPHDSSQGAQLYNLNGDYIFTNDGQETVVLPYLSQITAGSWPYGKYYEIQAIATITSGPGATYAKDSSDNLFTINAPTVTTVLDKTPRIAYWSGKVNQHVDSLGNWLSDPDGTSGANIDKLIYCKKWYPNTTSVESYKSETITTWKRAIGYEQSDYTNTVVTDKCVQKTIVSTSSITVLSPNGGEVYTAGQQVTIKWKTNNVERNPNTLVAIMDDRIPDWQTLSLFGSSPALNFAQLISSSGTENVYQYTFTIPSTFNATLPSQYQNIYGGNHYKILVNVLIGGQAGTSSQQVIEDLSDNTFTINAQSTNLPDGCTSTSGYSTTTGLPCSGTSSSCSIKTTPSITVLSPNGGEVYQDGQQITITWKSCNVSTDSLIILSLISYDPSNTNIAIGSVGLTTTTKNDGSETITLPTIVSMQSNGLPGYYKISSGRYFKVLVSTPDPDPRVDLSDNLFTINATNTNLVDGCTSTAGYSTITGQPCSGIYSSATTAASSTTYTNTSFTFTKSLKLGLRSDEVTELQKHLSSTNVYSGPVTGYFGPLTLEGVKNFQRKYGLIPDGIIGSKTLEALNSQ